MHFFFPRIVNYLHADNRLQDYSLSLRSFPSSNIGGGLSTSGVSPGQSTSIWFEMASLGYLVQVSSHFSLGLTHGEIQVFIELAHEVNRVKVMS